jgi:hypothetical protein
MRSDPELVARQVRCPLCGAAAGLPCLNTATRQPFQTGTVHRERTKKAQHVPYSLNRGDGKA